MQTCPMKVWRMRCLKISILLLSIANVSSGTRAAQASQRASTESGQTLGGATDIASHDLHITINPSTANIIQGAVYGLDAELENVSNLPLSVDRGVIQLAVQPELAPPNVSCTWFYTAVANPKVPMVMLMQPGDHFTVFFATGPKDSLRNSPQCQATYWGRLRRQLDFVPGNFSFVLTGTFSTPKAVSPSAQPSISSPQTSLSSQIASTPEEHYFPEAASLPVTIDQSQIIIYAGLGGLLGFLVMSFRNSTTLSEYAAKVQSASLKPPPKFLIILRQAAGVILISVTVTVIASRLSTTSFPVRVSVQDFLGALTVGFVAYFVGGKFIDKLSETLAPSSGSSGTLPNPATVPAVVTAAPSTVATAAAPIEDAGVPAVEGEQPR
jgi:hypothetical protein